MKILALLKQLIQSLSQALLDSSLFYHYYLFLPSVDQCVQSLSRLNGDSSLSQREPYFLPNP